MKKLMGLVWRILEVLIIIYVIVITSFILSRNKYNYTQFGDYTFVNIDLLAEKNINGVKSGDLLIVKNSNDINKGDVIYYYAVREDNYIVKSNAVLDVKSDSYNSLYTVNDDNNNTIAGARVLGKYTSIYHGIGGILSILESKFGFLLLVLLPIMVVFIYQIYEFVLIIKENPVLEDENENDKKDIKEKEEKN